ncbi:MAG: hypothetical protein FWD19_01725 [Defluviitaleaceae bacterium]|nr:hypothetical protein [Defluviitaleaceae bacterium]
MESRKRRNLAIEGAKKKKKLVAKGILAACLLAVVAALGFGVWDVANRRTIMIFNGEKIPSTDFRFFNELSGGASPEAALRDLKNTLVLLERSAQHNIFPTDEEIAEQLDGANEMRDSRNLNFISAHRIAEILSVWDVPFESLKDIYVPEDGFEVDEEEFAENLEWQMDRILMNATDMKIKYIKTRLGSSIEGAEELLNAGMDFDNLIRTYCDDFEISLENDPEPIELVQFVINNQAWDYFGGLMAMEVGDVSEIIEIADENDDYTFFLVQVEEKEVDEEQIETAKDGARTEFISGKRSEIFFEKVQEWADAANVKLNSRAYKRFESAAPPQPNFDFGDFDFDYDYDYENDFDFNFDDFDFDDFDFGDFDFDDFDFEIEN